MVWNKEKISNHIKAAKLLNKIKDDVFDYIKTNKNITEYEIQQFILEKFIQNKLKADKDPPIVAFNENSVIPHYFPSKISKKLEDNSIILLDIWAKLNQKNSPFADITWIAYYGKKIPNEILKVFNIIINARDFCINFIKSRLETGKIPTGKEIDETVMNIIDATEYKENISHRTGHCIELTSAHGIYKNVNHKNNSPLAKNLGYTIEPGIYLKDKFGIRSEINFFIDENLQLIVTTNIQNKIIKI